MKILLKIALLGLVLTQPAVAELPRPIGPPVVLPQLPVDTRCEVSTSSPVIDYGNLSRGQLQDRAGGRQLTPGQRTMTLNVTCPFSQTLRLKLLGDRAANGDLRYGHRGSLSLRIVNARLDGENVQMAANRGNGRQDKAGRSELSLQPGDSITVIRNGQPARGKNFTARIEVEPVIPLSAARASARETSEARITLDLID